MQFEDSIKKFLRFIRSLVFSMSCISSQKKNLCFGKQADFQIHMNGVGAVPGLVMARYTFFVEYLGKIHLSFSIADFSIEVIRELNEFCSLVHCSYAIIDSGVWNILYLSCCI
jgi:hypothetical protein